MCNSFISEFCIKDNMMLPLLIDKTYVNEEYIESVANVFDVQRFLNCLPWRLTLEQKQRCALACAIVKKPGIILYDEPSELIEHNAFYKMLDLLRLAQSQYGQTVIIATGNTGITAKVDRVIYT